jgi:hypothetical protein
MDQLGDDFDLDSLRLDPRHPGISPAKGSSRKHHRPFLKGPVPMHWLSVAAKLPGKALAVGLWLWFSSGLTRSPTIKFSVSHLEDWGVPPSTARRALKSLEGAGLVRVERLPGCKARVTIITDGDASALP